MIYLRALTRRKNIDGQLLYSPWTKRLGSFDLLGLNLCLDLSTGLFVVIPYCVKFLAGPSTILSILLAFVIAMITGSHFVEMSTRLPKSGSVYFYAYTNFGEFVAFFIGWTTVVDYCSFSAVVLKSWSNYANYLFSKPPAYYHSVRYTAMTTTMSSTTFVHNYTTLNGDNFNSNETLVTWPFWDGRVDFLMIFGLLISTIFAISSIRVIGTICVVLSIVCMLVSTSSILVGFFYIKSELWIKYGYFSNSLPGVIRATLLMLRAFSGIETTSFLTEEVTNHNNHFPLIVPLCNAILFIFYFFTCLVITLVVPFTNLPSQFILPNVFGMINVPASRYVISVGAVCCFSGAALAVVLPAARLLFSMGQDGLLCPAFGFLMGKKGGSPLIGHIAAFLLTSVLLFVDINCLIHLTLATVPIRWLICTCAALLSRYNDTTTGLLSDVAEYKRLKKLRSITSFFGSGVTSSENGTADLAKLFNEHDRLQRAKSMFDCEGQSNDESGSDDDAYTASSMGSSLFAKKIAFDQIGQSSLKAFVQKTKTARQNKVRQGVSNYKNSTQGYTEKNGSLCTSQQVESPRLLDSAVNKLGARKSRSSVQPLCDIAAQTVTRSASNDDNSSFQYLRNDVRLPTANDRKHSMQSISLSESTETAITENHHNCFRSPCTPFSESTGQSQRHIYQPDHGLIPSYVNDFGMKPVDSNYGLEKVAVYHRAKTSLVICLLSMIAFCTILVRFWPSLTVEKHWWAISGLCLLALVVIVCLLYFIWLPQNVDSSTKNKVSASPYLSLLNCFLLCLTLVAVDNDGYFRLLIAFSAGFLIYIAYSCKHSHENAQQPMRVNISLTDPDFHEDKSIIPSKRNSQAKSEILCSVYSNIDESVNN